MFNNIGGKIKGLASFIAWLGIIGSIISGIVMMAITEELIVVGILVAIIGGISSWIGSFLLYGFGELIENSAILVRIVNNNISKISTSNGSVGMVSQTNQNKTQHLHKWKGKCQMCDKEDVMITAAVIVDDLGTRYRNVCDRCYEKHNCKPKNN